MWKLTLKQRFVPDNLSHANLLYSVDEDNRTFPVAFETRRRRNDHLGVDNDKVYGIWRVIAAFVFLLLLILLVWFCQYLCSKLFKKYQKVKCRHLEDEDYPLTQSLLQKESCANESSLNKETQSMNDEYYKDSILLNSTSQEKQHLLNFVKSRNQLYTDLPKRTISQALVNGKNGENERNIADKLLSPEVHLSSLTSKERESMPKINLSSEENQRIPTLDVNKWATLPFRPKAKSDIIRVQTKQLCVKNGNKTVKSFSDSDIKMMKTTHAATITLREIKRPVTQCIHDCSICKSKEYVKAEFKGRKGSEGIRSEVNDTSVEHQRMTEMYDDLGMLFSLYMKQQSHLCQRKYCLISRHLQQRKNHDETKCQMRSKSYQHSYAQPKCNSGSVCYDTYDEYKLMFVSPSERKDLYKNIYSRRKRFLNQPCLSPHVEMISKNVE